MEIIHGPMRIAGLLVLGLGLTTGCQAGEAKKNASQAASVEQAVLTAFGQAGLKVGPFEKTAAQPYGAAACVRGEVELLDLLLCRYASAGDASAGEAKLLGFTEGSVSGAVRRSGNTVLAVADRNKSDLKGRRINALLKLFEQQRPL